MTFLEGLRKSALKAILSNAWDNAYVILDLGLSYGYSPIPREADKLWAARCKLGMARSFVCDPNQDHLWDKYTQEALKLLEEE